MWDGFGELNVKINLNTDIRFTTPRPNIKLSLFWCQQLLPIAINLHHAMFECMILFSMRLQVAYWHFGCFLTFLSLSLDSLECLCRPQTFRFSITLRFHKISYNFWMVTFLDGTTNQNIHSHKFFDLTIAGSSEQLLKRFYSCLIGYSIAFLFC